MNGEQADLTQRYMRETLRYSVVLLCAALMAAGSVATTESLALPGGGGGIGFDDMGFAVALHQVLVPAGRTGYLDLVDPATLEVTPIGGFVARNRFAGGHGQGVTSADEGNGFFYATDRDAEKLVVIDAKSRSVMATAPLAAGPDYVRFVSPAEVWVTEPGTQRIEIFALPQQGVPQPHHAQFIEVPGGPESLVIDAARGRAYTNLWTDTTFAIDLKSRRIVARWKNGCSGSRGLALDDARAMLFVGCEEGKLSVLNLATGDRLGQASSGRGVDIIAYNSRLRHVYLPGAESGTMAIIAISPTGAARVLQVMTTANGAHCVVADDRNRVYVCDPRAGRLLVLSDPFPRSDEAHP